MVGDDGVSGGIWVVVWCDVLGVVLYSDVLDMLFWVYLMLGFVVM